VTGPAGVRRRFGGVLAVDGAGVTAFLVRAGRGRRGPTATLDAVAALGGWLAAAIALRGLPDGPVSDAERVRAARWVVAGTAWTVLGAGASVLASGLLASVRSQRRGARPASVALTAAGTALGLAYLRVLGAAERGPQSRSAGRSAVSRTEGPDPSC
jgi:hypothetical protein